jgi:hypothetical protein
MPAGPVDTGRRMTDIRALVLNCKESPEKTAQTNASVAANAAHLARLLEESPYPPS